MKASVNGKEVLFFIQSYSQREGDLETFQRMQQEIPDLGFKFTVTLAETRETITVLLRDIKFE